MDEYIPREAAREILCGWCRERESCDGSCLAEKELDALPAADVVPVVRCRDCKHRDPEDKKCDCGGLEHAHMFPVADDWFCADGERKGGDGE